MRVGTDIIHIPTFAKRLASPGFIERAFLESELGRGDPEHLAGVLAAKEAYFKSLGKAPPQWLDVEIVYTESGQPQIANTISSVSISHDGDYAVAVVLAL